MGPPGNLRSVTVSAPPVRPRAIPRHRDGFGGLTPGGAAGETPETLVICLGVEHHLEGAAVSLLLLTSTPGLVDWDPREGLAVSDDGDGMYDVTPISMTSGLGQIAATVWITPAISPDVHTLHLDVDAVRRLNPSRGDGGVTRELTGGPWSMDVDLRPPRTLETAPLRPRTTAVPDDAHAVPTRTRAAFDSVVPVGQAHLVEDAAFCLTAVERYADRWVATVVALGPEREPRQVPVVGRATLCAWDDVGTTYRLTAMGGEAQESWSQCAYEALPALNPEATVLAVEMTDIPRGRDPEPRHPIIDGPIVFASVIPS